MQYRVYVAICIAVELLILSALPPKHLTHPQCLTSLNRDYLPLLHLHRKTVRAHSKITNIIAHESHLFEHASFLLVTSTNVRIRPLNFLTFSFDFFVTLL